MKAGSFDKVVEEMDLKTEPGGPEGIRKIQEPNFQFFHFSRETSLPAIATKHYSRGGGSISDSAIAE